MTLTARQDAAASLLRSARQIGSESVEVRATSPEVADHLNRVSILLTMAATWIETSPDIDAFEAPLKAVVGRRAVADDDEIARHAEKQGVSWADAWRYFEINGYDMSAASPQYDS